MSHLGFASATVFRLGFIQVAFLQRPWGRIWSPGSGPASRFVSSHFPRELVPRRPGSPSCRLCSRNRTRPHAKCMFLGFSGFLPHVIGLFRLFSAPEAFMLPASKAGGWGGVGGWGGGDDDMHCQLHQLPPFRLSGEMPANQSKRCLFCGRHGHNLLVMKDDKSLFDLWRCW